MIQYNIIFFIFYKEMTSTEVEPIYETLKVDNEYEITTNTEPHIIRRKLTGHIVSVWDNGNGYKRINLNNKKYRYHRVLAIQFIPNPNPDLLTEVDHINHIRSDNRIENLRWISTSDNQRNKASYNGIPYTYIDKLSENAITIDEYGEYTLEDYYYDNGKFYYHNGYQYRELKLCKNPYGAYFVNMLVRHNKSIAVYVNKFKRLYDIKD